MLALVLVVLFFVLGVALGPLLVAALTVALDDRRGHRVADMAVGLGLKSVWKPVLSFTAQDELTLKKRSFSEKHDREYLTFGGFFSGIKRHLWDLRDRLHPFYGTPFGFVDERFGVIVDPRDALLGEELRRAHDNGTYEHRTTEDGSLHESVLAAFEVPSGYNGVQLSHASVLFGGSLDSQIIDRVRDLYETSQAPKGETSALRQLLVPVGAFFGVVLLLMFAAGQTGGGGGGGGGGPAPAPNNTTVEVGATLALLLLSTSGLPDWLKEYYETAKKHYETVKEQVGPYGARLRTATANAADATTTATVDALDAMGNPHQGNWRDRIVIGSLLVVAALIAAGLYLVFPVPVSVLAITLPLGVWAVIALVVGMIMPAFIASFFGRSLGPLGIGLGKLYITIGLLGYDQPVISYDEGRYKLVEYDNHDWEVEPQWYRFALTRIGIGFANGVSAWPDGTTMDNEQVESLQGTHGADHAPDDYAPTDEIQVGDIHGHLPKDPGEDAVYVRTRRTTGWFLEAGQGHEMVGEALQNAKQELGGGEKPVGDKYVLAATLTSMLVATILSWAVFF